MYTVALREKKERLMLSNYCLNSMENRDGKQGWKLSCFTNMDFG